MAFWDRNMVGWISDALENLGVYDYDIEMMSSDAWMVYLRNGSMDLERLLAAELAPHFSGNGWYQAYVFMDTPNEIEVFVGDAE